MNLAKFLGILLLAHNCLTAGELISPNIVLKVGTNWISLEEIEKNAITAITKKDPTFKHLLAEKTVFIDPGSKAKRFEFLYECDGEQYMWIVNVSHKNKITRVIKGKIIE